MAASNVNAAPVRMNGTVTPTTAEDEDLYTQLLRLQDVVLAGKHLQFKLPPAAVEQLQVALTLPEVAVNNLAHATNNAFPPAAKLNGLPGLGARAALDPIFLEKSDSLVRAESHLKRQRLERDLQTQQEQRKHMRIGRDSDHEPFSLIAVDEVLRAAQERVKPVSGLKPSKATSASSFDENDYYSSRAPSDWSSFASSSKGSDKGAGAFTAGFERLDRAQPAFAEPSIAAQKRKVAAPAFAKVHRAPQQTHVHEGEDVFDLSGDEDDEYTPPDAAAFDNPTRPTVDVNVDQDTPDDDMSDYEPGEITQDSTAPVPYHPSQRAAQPPSSHVPIIRNNHLTHIAAPQPNRVSPLATAKGPNIELELVNGRPEVVQKPKPQQRYRPMRSRVSTASPSGPGSNNRRKQRGKKRKREPEPSSIASRVKKRRDREIAHSPPSPVQREPYIKDEPVSPPPFAPAPEVPPYEQPVYRAQPGPVGFASPRGETHQRHVHEPQPSGLRYEYVRPESPVMSGVASPSGYRLVQRDTQDLRRAASMHYVQRPASPAQRLYPPVGTYRTASSSYAEPLPTQNLPQAEHSDYPRYANVSAESRVQHTRVERAPSPPRMQEYHDPYARVQSPALMAPPAPRRIVVDQYGNRYHAADPTPVSARASVAPVEMQHELQPVHERALSRMSIAYAPAPATRYEPVDARMAALPPPARRHHPRVEYVDANDYHGREYSTRPVETQRYALAPTSPVYQDAPRYKTLPPPAPPGPAERTSPVHQVMPRYEVMGPPPAPLARERTSPVYQPVPRSYSVRPQEAPQPAMGNIRQASVASVQYVRQDMVPPPPAPPYRAISVAPGLEYGAQSQQQEYRALVQQPAFGYAPQAARYVDQYGREVEPQQLRQGSVARY